MAPAGLKWKPLAVRTSLTVSGGYQNKAYTLETTEVQVSSQQEVFVKIDKNSEWVLKASLGPTGQRGALKRTKVIEELKMKVNANGTKDAVAASIPDDVGGPAVAGDDPMDASRRRSAPHPSLPPSLSPPLVPAASLAIV